MNLTLCFLVVLAMPLCGAIQPIDSIREVEEHLELVHGSLLVVFDIDEVLLAPANPVFRAQNIVRHRSVVRKHVGPLSGEDRNRVLKLLLESTGSLLIEQATPKLIRALQEKDIPTLALTAGYTGRGVENACLADWRRDRLADVGIDFSHNQIFDDDIIFDEMEESLGSYPMYKHGLLITNGRTVSKGDLLTRFFEHTGFRPEIVIFIDDKQSYLESVDEALDKLGITHIGLHYPGSAAFFDNPIDEEEADATWSALVSRAVSVAT